MSPVSSCAPPKQRAVAGPVAEPEKSWVTLAKNWQSPSVSTEMKNFPHFASRVQGGTKKNDPNSLFRLPRRSARPSGLKAGGVATPLTMVAPLLCQLVMVMRGKAPTGMLA